MSDNIRVFRIGGNIQDIAIQEGTTVQQVLDSADIVVQPHEEVRVNDVDVTAIIGNTIVPNGATVMVVQKVKGNT